MRNFFRRLNGMPDLKTSRLRLVAMTPAMLEADAARDGSLGGVLGARLTEEWPPFEWEAHVVEMIFMQATELPDLMGWHRYVLLAGEREGSVLVGCVGGFPKADGVVEIGYSTLPEFQRRGIGTEAATTLVDWLLRQESVHAITAQALTEAPESIKIMERCGLRFVGEGDDPGTVRFRRERVRGPSPRHFWAKVRSRLGLRVDIGPLEGCQGVECVGLRVNG